MSANQFGPASRQRATRQAYPREIVIQLRELASHAGGAEGLLLGLLMWLEDWLIILVAVATGCWMMSLPTTPITVLAILASIAVIGTRQRALATIMHEASHKNFARDHSAVRTIIASVGAAWPILQLTTAYRTSHVGAHHPELGNGLDPDTREYWAAGGFVQEPVRWLMSNIALRLCGLKALSYLRYTLRDRLLPPSDGTPPAKGYWLELAGLIGFWLTVLGIVAATGTGAEFLILWVLPYLTVYQATGWLIETAEHFPLVAMSNNHVEMTRNRHGGPLENFFFGAHGENYHRVHHEHPAIPPWKLAQAHRLLMTVPEYSASDSESGGLLTRGRNGAPSIISQLPRQIREAQVLLGARAEPFA